MTLYTFYLLHIAYTHCLEYDPYPFDGDNCLEPHAIHWARCLDWETAIPNRTDCDQLLDPICSASNPVTVQGHLKKHENFWLNKLEPSSFVSSIITDDYRLPFLRLPDPLVQLNHRSALENATFVGGAIDEFVSGRCVIECDYQYPIVCSPLSVVVNASRKQCLVLDLRYVN